MARCRFSVRIEQATELIACFVKALAEVATGHDDSEFVPLDLVNPMNEIETTKWNELAKAKEDLEKSEKVLIPSFIDETTPLNVIGVFPRITGKDSVPDPFLLACKAAISWMIQNKQPPLPACPDTDWSASSENTDSGDTDWSTSSPPGVPEFVHVPPVVRQ